MERMDGADAGDVERARAGDADAFRVLVERHSRSLFRVAYRLTGNEQDAEDVVQEAFLKAYRRLDQFESRAEVGSWLYRIAANCAVDVLRARRRRDEQPLWHGTEDEAVPLELPAPGPGSDWMAHASELRRRIGTAMSRLSPLERAAFVLRHFEERSTREIGEALGLETSAVKQSVFRAVRKMRAALAPVAGLSALERGHR
jgi:RNA polymerase sigma-70 factor, ECF subfamily